VSTSRYVLQEPTDSSGCTSKLHGKAPIKHLRWRSRFVLARCREDLTLCGAGGEMSARASALAALSPGAGVLGGLHTCLSLAAREGKQEVCST